MKYGRLTVIGPAPRGNNYAKMWRVRCECGVEKIARDDKLKTGRTKSCGCRPGAMTHGMSNTRAYNIWLGMKTRCKKKTHKSYHNYGARGIKVCKRWQHFENFFEDMGEPPAGMTIERKNNNRGYCRSNCRWATLKEQHRNRRNNIIIDLNGETRVLSDWCEKLDVNYMTVYQRLRRGLPPEEAFGGL